LIERLNGMLAHVPVVALLGYFQVGAALDAKLSSKDRNYSNWQLREEVSILVFCFLHPTPESSQSGFGQEQKLAQRRTADILVRVHCGP
jgi:hypothetical protein